MKKIQCRMLLLSIVAIICFGISLPANAVLIETDDSNFGANAITMDTDSGLGWLDLSLSTDMSYLEMIGQLEVGGDFYGFRHATTAEVESLFEAAGIPHIDSSYSGGSSADNLAPSMALLDLIGATSFQDSYPQALGISGSFYGSDMAYCPSLDFFYSNGVEVYSATSEAIRFPFYTHIPSAGHWLVKDMAPVPEPATMTLLGIGLVGIAGISRKRIK